MITIIRYKTSDETICDGYFPVDGKLKVMDIFLGTNASSYFMVYLAFNKYVLDAPL